MAETAVKSKSKNPLLKQFQWFKDKFESSLRLCSNDFLPDGFNIHFQSLSLNMNILSQGASFFVTKIRIAPKVDLFIRLEDGAVEQILRKTLGDNNKRFSLSSITELEAKIITAFNDHFYELFSEFLYIPKEIKKKNTDVVHMTLFIRDDETCNTSKVIVSIPRQYIAPGVISLEKENFSDSFFKNIPAPVKLRVGSTKFAVRDIKLLEIGDIVLFENSDIRKMTLVLDEFKHEFSLAPNPSLIISDMEVDTNGGLGMDNTKNIWDSLQVEMGAEFEKIKIPLGELKNIEEGLVVDISSVYNNKISLKVENKLIAKGELVIVNDRYGVRIEELFTEDESEEEVAMANQLPPVELEMTQSLNSQNVEPQQDVIPQASQSNTSEEFDYSDFELDDQDI